MSSIYVQLLYSIVNRTYNDGIRVGSIEPEYEGVNSILLNPIKILLCMKLYINQNLYDQEYWERFVEYHNYVEEFMYDVYVYEEDYLN